MTIAGWFAFSIMTILLVALAVVIIAGVDRARTRILAGAICIVVCVSLLFGMLWFFRHTASGQRALVDQKSNLANGIERTITVYTADGNIIAQYEGRIDIEANDGGYIKFDFEGKRYIYYNCFVESIAVIE